MSDQPGTLVIRPKYFFLLFVLGLCRPRASVNGTEVAVAWSGPALVPEPPGRYEVAVWCPYLFLSRMGYSAMVVDVYPGAAVEVVWNAPWFVVLAGSISAHHVLPALMGPAHARMPMGAPMPVTPGAGTAGGVGGGGGAGWHPDPTGRHQLRWWDGQGWTPAVHDGGVHGTDPV